MMTLIQFPWSPFCITIRSILERNAIPFRVHNIPFHDRTRIIKMTEGRGHSVPCLLNGKTAVCDVTDFGQEVAGYLDQRFALGLFPKEKEGIQFILSRYIEHDVEMIGFKVNDSYIIPTRPLVEQVMLVRHKERKFGKGCVEQWIRRRGQLKTQFREVLEPIDTMLASSPFLLSTQPLFVDHNLFGIVENYLYSGKTSLPNMKHLKRWHHAMSQQ